MGGGGEGGEVKLFSNKNLVEGSAKFRLGVPFQYISGKQKSALVAKIVLLRKVIDNVLVIMLERSKVARVRNMS